VDANLLLRYAPFYIRLCTHKLDSNRSAQ